MLSGLSLLLDLVLLAEDVFAPTHSRLPQFGVIEHAALGLTHAVQLFGGIQLRRVSFYRFAYIGAVACCVPCFSPFGVIGIPFGIYAIALLQQHEIVVAFRAHSRLISLRKTER